MRAAEALQSSRLESADAPRVAGRGLARGAAPAQPNTAARQSNGAVGGMLAAGPGGATPFASSQVNVGSNIAPAEANSNRVVGLVLALVFSMGVGAVIISFILVFGFLTFKGAGPVVVEEELALKDEHDSGVVEDPDLQRVITVQNGRRAAAAAAVVKDPMAEMFGGLGAAPVTVHVKGPGREQYHGIEILCNMVSFRDRASIRNDRAHIAIVPAARCRLVFQGNVPVKSWVTGGDTVTCTFNPIVCR